MYNLKILRFKVFQNWCNHNIRGSPNISTVTSTAADIIPRYRYYLK